MYSCLIYSLSLFIVGKDGFISHIQHPRSLLPPQIHHTYYNQYRPPPNAQCFGKPSTPALICYSCRRGGSTWQGELGGSKEKSIHSRVNHIFVWYNQSINQSMTLRTYICLGACSPRRSWLRFILHCNVRMLCRHLSSYSLGIGLCGIHLNVGRLVDR